MALYRLPSEVKEFFPYDDLRIGQKEIIERIYSAVRNKKHIIIEASNGIGKTISALAAILPIALEFDLKVIYLSRTHTQLERVIDELIEIYRKKGISISAIELRAKRDMCLHPMVYERNLTAHDAIDICHVLRKTRKCKYYERLKDTKLLYSVLSQLHEIPIKSREIIEVGKRYGICPYELNKYLIEKARVISAPYIYLLDQRIREIFFKNIGEYAYRLIFVFDEAHNLPFLATDTNSYSLSINTVLRAINEAREFKLKYSESILNELKDFMENFPFEKPGEVLMEKDELIAYFPSLEFSIATLENDGNIVKETKIKADKLPISYISSVARFLMAWEDADPETHAFLFTVTRGKRGLIQHLEVVALDARESIDPLLECISTVSLSGTLHESYAIITGISEYNYDYFVAPVPFGTHQYLVLGVSDVTSRLVERNVITYKKIIEYINAAVENTPHNVGVFFPSYDVLQDVIDLGIVDILRKCGKEIFIENPEMSSIENERMIIKYKKAADKSGGILLGVMGGRNCEGIDYPGKEMETAIIVGIPLAKPTVRVEALIEYYKKRFGRKGKMFGYVIPAIYKAAQTAGRVIRSPDDRGVILLVDKRYLWGYYKDILPNWLRYNIIKVKNPKEVELLVRKFFSSG